MLSTATQHKHTLNRAFQLNLSQKTIAVVFITLLTFVLRSDVVEVYLNTILSSFHILVSLPTTFSLLLSMLKPIPTKRHHHFFSRISDSS